jgi:hypothetical protein
MSVASTTPQIREELRAALHVFVAMTSEPNGCIVSLGFFAVYLNRADEIVGGVFLPASNVRP